MTKTIERIGLIVAGAGLGARLLASTGLWGWCLGLGILAAGGAYAYDKWLYHPATNP